MGKRKRRGGGRASLSGRAVDTPRLGAQFSDGKAIARAATRRGESCGCAGTQSGCPRCDGSGIVGGMAALPRPRHATVGSDPREPEAAQPERDHSKDIGLPLARRHGRIRTSGVSDKPPQQEGPPPPTPERSAPRESAAATPGQHRGQPEIKRKDKVHPRASARTHPAPPRTRNPPPPPDERTQQARASLQSERAERRLDATYGVGGTARDRGEFGSPSTHDGMDDDSEP